MTTPYDATDRETAHDRDMHHAAGMVEGALRAHNLDRTGEHSARIWDALDGLDDPLSAARAACYEVHVAPATLKVAAAFRALTDWRRTEQRR